jgi:pantoate--beta-alanine ligase
MRIVKSVSGLATACREYKRLGRKVGFVPTMGAFHSGHLSLMRRAAAENDVVIVSLFINPLQFGQGEDLAAYPRQLGVDRKLARQAGTSLLFCPEQDRFYPAGFDSLVRADRQLAAGLEGGARPGHFDGVCTVLARFFHLVGSCRTYMGQKDYQQFRVVEKMVSDLSFDLSLVLCPIIRERSGLAMSSRNSYLSAQGLDKASCLHQSLLAGQRLVKAGERSVARLRRGMIKPFSLSGVRPAYVEAVQAKNLESIKRLSGGVALLVAAKVEGVRLVDNLVINRV